MLKISKDKLDEFLRILGTDTDLFLPVDDEVSHTSNYQKWEEGVKYSTQLNTVKSAKDFFFPQHETLIEFKTHGQEIEVVDHRSEVKDFIIFGVRQCDLKSFEILDRVFLQNPVDPFYKARRDHGIIITMSCRRPDSTCFCTVYGIDPTHPGGDISGWNDDDNYYFEANSEKGKALLEKVASLGAEGGQEEVKELQKQLSAILEKLPFGDLDLSRFKGQNLIELFNSPLWKELSVSCLGCGSCTFVCPTCQCFDIKDFDTGNGIQRFRTWDSCMYSDFTKMAAANPRLTQTERFRQRFMHKMVYYPDQYDGVYSCVGCGRCLKKCPISMNIVKVIKEVGGAK